MHSLGLLRRRSLSSIGGLDRALVRLDTAPAHCGLINTSSFFSFSSDLLASSQHQTTHCLPDYRRKTNERIPIPFLPALPFPFTSLKHRNQQNCHHTAVVRPPFNLVLDSLFHTNKKISISPVRRRVPLPPLHRYPRHRHSTYSACIYAYACHPAPREGHRVLIRNLYPFLPCVLCSRLSNPLSTPSLPPSPFPLVVYPYVQDDISTVAAMFLSIAPSFTNARLQGEHRQTLQQVSD